MNYDAEIKNIYDNTFIYNNEFNKYEDDFAFWLYWINKIKPSKVLEIGIGNGRLIKLLSNYVPVYDGLDFSINIIKDFKEKNKWFSGNLFNQDMREINIDNTYDLIILPFNTFCYLYTFDDILRFFEGIKKISNDKTLIIIDIINPQTADLRDCKKYKLRNNFLIDNIKYKLYEKHFYDYSKQIITYSKKYILSNNKNIKMNLPVRIFFHQELINLIKLVGFANVGFYGDYDNETYNSCSRKQIFFLKRSDDNENIKLYTLD